MSNTRQKRKSRAQEEQAAAVVADHDLPELKEAVEAQRIVAQLEARDAERSKTLNQPLNELGTVAMKNVVESLLFAADKPLSVLRIKQLLRRRSDDGIREALDELKVEYLNRGILLHKVAGGFQFRTHPETARWVQQLIAGRPVRLSRAQLETLAIIAYRQPVTRPEVDEIRGVDSGGTLRILQERSLIRVLGKKEEPGRPLLYGTTKDFLEFFNLQDLRELPTLQEYHVLSEDSMAEAQRLGVDLSADEGVDQSRLFIVPDPEEETAEGAESTGDAQAAAADGEAAVVADGEAVVADGEAAVAEDSDEEVVAEDSDEEVVAEDSDEEVVAEDSDEEVVAEDSDEEVVAEDSDEEVVAEDSDEEVVAEDSDEEVVAEDSDEEVVAEDSDEEVVAEDGDDDVAEDSDDDDVAEDSDDDEVAEATDADGSTDAADDDEADDDEADDDAKADVAEAGSEPDPDQEAAG